MSGTTTDRALALAVHIPDGARLRALLTAGEDLPVLADGEGSSLVGAARCERLYFGVEFCERLIPAVGEVEEALRGARERGWGLTLLTPYATDEGLRRLVPLLALLEAEPAASPVAPTTEVVVNDWGVLRLIQREYPALEPVLGRLLNRSLKDPRVMPLYASASTPRLPAAVARQSSAALTPFRAILRWFGVRRVETDFLLQGMETDYAGGGLSATLHLPYGYVATGRICPAASLHAPAEEKFTPYRECRRECRGASLELRDARSLLGDRDLVLIQKGNTVFYRVGDAESAGALPGLAALGVDRVAWAREVPL